MRRFALLALVGVLFTTHEAMAGWVEQKSQFGDGNNNMAVSSGDCKTAVVVGTTKGGQGDQAVLWTTKDGGTTWSQGQPPQSGMMAFWIDVWMTSASVGYMGGMDFGGSPVMVTTNGGAAWQKVPSANASQTVNRLFFGQGGVPGFALGDKLSVTSNGAMWQTVEFDAGEAGMASIMFANAMEGWMVGGKTETDEETGAVTLFDEGTVLHSTDGGLTWTTIASKQPYSYGSVWFPTPALGFVTGFDGSVYHLFQSTDHGATWTEVSLPAHPSGSPIYALTSMHFSSTTNGWLVGAAGQEGGGVGNKPLALHTTDGGQTWVYEDGYEGSGGTFFDVWACNDGEAFFVGDWGKIDKWTKGGYVAPDGAEVIVTESGEIIEPAGPWADVLGGFVDGQVQANGGAGGDAMGGGDGATLGDGTSTTTKEVCTDKEVPASGGCAVGGLATGGAPGALVAVLALLGLLVVRRGRRARVGTRCIVSLRVTSAMGAILALVACGGDGGTKIEKECKTVTVQTTFDFDTTGGEDGAEPVPAPTCLLTDAAKPALPATGGRAAWTNPFLAFARTIDGVDQVVVMDPDGGGELTLTGLEQAGARVLATAWSPDRTRVAFLSDFWSDHSTYRTNVFVAGLDPLSCFMSTPNVAEGLVGEGISMRLQGFLKGATGGGGALIAVPQATVGSTRGGDTAATNQAGGYVIDVPGGDGTLVFRRVAHDAAGNEDYWGAVVPYLAAGGMQQSLDGVGRASGGNTRLDAFAWRPDGTGFLVVRSGKRLGVEGKDEAFAELAEYDAATSAFVTVTLPADVTEVRHWMPPVTLSGGVRVLPWVHQDHTGHLTFVFGTGEGESQTLAAPGLFYDDAARQGSRVVVAPQDYLAWITDDGTLALLGADETGQLENEARDAFPGRTVVPDELDWSPDGLRVVATTKQGDATDLYVVDVNTLQGEALTSDGASHAPAWYGR
jgi:photosystem II stability/assembly factor-like uncharacterized protein